MERAGLAPRRLEPLSRAQRQREPKAHRARAHAEAPPRRHPEPGAMALGRAARAMLEREGRRGPPPAWLLELEEGLAHPDDIPGGELRAPFHELFIDVDTVGGAEVLQAPSVLRPAEAGVAAAARSRTRMCASSLPAYLQGVTAEAMDAAHVHPYQAGEGGVSAGRRG